jgi:D-alanyl-lipoteichoic acid acyltransferase DltB (MBOAT superfamily)
MIGIVVILHFGVFHLLSCGWRTVGVDARPLMNWPLTSRGIGEFWGARWNTAFRDLTHRFVFRPLVPRVGVAGAVLLGFFGSGVVHDIVISIPARGGYGGPTLYFLVQGCAILVSRGVISKKIHLRNGLVGWSFTILTLVLPAPMLFHDKFVLDVIIPFMVFLGAIA